MSSALNQGGVVLFGGIPQLFGSLLADTWRWNGVGWQRLSPRTTPPGRTWHGMALDPSTNQPLMHAGAARSDTWRLGTDWQLASSGQPSSPMAAVHDGTNARIVVVTRVNQRVNTDWETWAWDGTNWNPLGHLRCGNFLSLAIAFDEARRRVVAHFDDYPVYQTWELNGSSWMRVSSNPPMGTNGQSVMAFDPVARHCILFVGSGQTWSWDGSSWQQLTPANSPSARSGAAMATDRDRQRVVLFGGNDGNNDLNDTWEWDGTSWLQRASPTTPSHWGQLAYDSINREVLSIDYRNGIWHYGPMHRADAAVFGAGCAGSLGVPAIDADFPWLGYPFEIGLDQVPSRASSFLMLGGSATSWGSLFLPFDLTANGLPGCSVLIRPDAIGPMVLAGNRATWPGTVPNTPTLLGNSLFGQAILLSAGGSNPAGAALSDAVELVVGAK